jgi:hypothetical protein
MNLLKLLAVPFFSLFLLISLSNNGFLDIQKFFSLDIFNSSQGVLATTTTEIFGSFN